MTNNSTKKNNIKLQEDNLENKEQDIIKIYHQHKPHIGPELNWEYKNKREIFEVSLVNLIIKEIFNPKEILSKFIKFDKNQTTLDDYFNKELEIQNIKYYQHKDNWNNRLILGDSLLVMNSLLFNENMEEKIQMIYFDPPYGIEFKYNYNLNLESKNVKNHEDEPEKIKVYQDTWELGIHSYLIYLRERLLLCRKLLRETGSIFVQINDTHLSYVIQILSEIFGKENFIAIIPFKKTGSATSKRLSSICDYLVWFSKNKKKMKYYQPYRKREINSNLFKTYNKIELEDGTRRNLTPVERKTGIFPNNSKLFTTISLASQHYSKERSKPFLYKGKKYTPPKNRQWSVSIEEGMRRLAEKNRLYATTNTLRFIYYLDDFPIIPIANMWDDTMGDSFQIYVVQTNTKILERCLLMTTNPGDVVFDPTCGSGTTVYVAEQWGRRWITCDTSRIAINLAKQRLVTSIFDYFKINDKAKNFDFIYKQYPHISASTIAYNKKIKYEKKYDDVKIDSSLIRVCAPFTLENLLSSPKMISFEGISKETFKKSSERRKFLEKIIIYLSNTGIYFPNGFRLNFKNIKLIDNKFIHAQGIIKEGNSSNIGIYIGPEFGDINLFQVENAIEIALHKGFDWFFVIGFGFNLSINLERIYSKFDSKKLKFEIVLINPEVQIEDLSRKTADSQIFSVVGHPEIEISKVGGKYQLELKTLKVFNPLTGSYDKLPLNRINAWYIDENFNNKKFFVHQVIFIKSNKIVKKLISKLKAFSDNENIKFLIGEKSIPFQKRESNQIAVKIIDIIGNESTIFLDISTIDSS